MKKTIIKNEINEVVNACSRKNALEFANLFTSSAIIILANGDSINGKENIYRVTKQYFSQLKFVSINIKDICIKGEEIIIEWQWQHTDIVKNEPKLNHNLINFKILYLNFKNNLELTQEFLSLK